MFDPDSATRKAILEAIRTGVHVVFFMDRGEAYLRLVYMSREPFQSVDVPWDATTPLATLITEARKFFPKPAPVVQLRMLKSPLDKSAPHADV